jgi:hypothetical protein
MATLAVTTGSEAPHDAEIGKPKLDGKTHGAGKIAFLLVRKRRSQTTGWAEATAAG